MNKIEKHVTEQSLVLGLGHIIVSPWLCMLLLGALYHRTGWAVNFDYITTLIIVAIIQIAYPETHTRVSGYVDYIVKNPTK